MKILHALPFVTLALLPLSAQAETRGTDAALGALSGALVFGPVGAVAGAVVGFTAGPAIGSSWGTNGSSRPRYRARTRPKQMESLAAPAQPAQSNPANVQAGQGSAAPVSASNPASSAQARMPAAGPTTPTAQTKAPPVQGFE